MTTPIATSAGQQILDTFEAEFGDIGDVAGITRSLIRLTIAVLLAALLGWNRERYGNAAGLRTHMLVGLGSALFVLVPLQSGMQIADVSRVLQGVIAGIGFLGAGAIIKMDDKMKVRGVTTAASIFMTAAIGVSAGMGREVLAILCTGLALAILALLPKLEQAASKRGDEPNDPDASDDEVAESPKMSGKPRR